MNTPSINYSEHRPNDLAWVSSYISYLGKEAFESFLNRVFARLIKMKVGEIYDLTKKVSSKNRDLFIKSACYFIQCGNMDYEFSNDYTTITRKERIKADLFAKKKQKEEEPELSNI